MAAMNYQSGPNQATAQGKSEGIPVLASSTPAIFVPTTIDFTETPPDLSPDPITRLESTLTELDKHASRVEQQIFWLAVREVERIRREGLLERPHYDRYHRPVKHPWTTIDTDLILEERMLRDDEWIIKKLFPDEELGDGDGDESGDERRERHPRPPSPPPPPPHPRGHWEPEQSGPESLLNVTPIVTRQTPRAVATINTLNLVKWGWSQLNGHAEAIKKEKETRRANLNRQMNPNIAPVATTGPPGPAQSHRSLVGGDPMDLD
ncbi:hypothetical protein F5Y19DRAFT_371190 [Xylariaceae sp. FL1651]|nr:hypothetical protein F5Y19DRAFT_371190 [Xylariaceae sp. FL1651]